MKIQSILLFLTLSSLLLAAYFFSSWYKERKDNNRLNQNFLTLSREMKKFDAKHVQLLELTKREIKNSFPELENRLKKEFDVKLKNTVLVSNTVTEVNHTFKTTIRDSVKLDTIQVQKISYKDTWIDFEAEKVNNDFYVNRNIVTVPLFQVIHRDKFRLKYLFKKRPLFQEIKSDNPYADIQYSRSIFVSK